MVLVKLAVIQLVLSGKKTLDIILDEKLPLEVRAYALEHSGHVSRWIDTIQQLQNQEMQRLQRQLVEMKRADRQDEHRRQKQERKQKRSAFRG